MESQQTKRLKRLILPTLIIATAIGLSWHFLDSTPTGCYNKIFAVGSSLCHQIPSHGFTANGVQFPVCARCTGLYLGSFIGLIYGFSSGKKAGMPKRGYAIFLILLFIFWGGDGVNSLISDFLKRPLFYETTNTTRLVTGFGMGLLMPTALVTLFNVTIWKKSENTAVLRHPAQIAGYVLLCSIASYLMLSNIRFLFNLTATIVISTALTIITLLYTIFWVILFRKENQFTIWSELWLFLLSGFATAILQIILLNTMRNTVLF